MTPELNKLMADLATVKTAIASVDKSWEEYLRVHGKTLTAEEYYSVASDGSHVIGRMVRLITELETLERRLAPPEIYQGHSRGR